MGYGEEPGYSLPLSPETPKEETATTLWERIPWIVKVIFAICAFTALLGGLLSLY